MRPARFAPVLLLFYVPSLLVFLSVLALVATLLLGRGAWGLGVAVLVVVFVKAHTLARVWLDELLGRFPRPRPS